VKRFMLVRLDARIGIEGDREKSPARLTHDRDFVRGDLPFSGETFAFSLAGQSIAAHNSSAVACRRGGAQKQKGRIAPAL
jgi:hypothetical protein